MDQEHVPPNQHNICRWKGKDDLSCEIRVILDLARKVDTARPTNSRNVVYNVDRSPWYTTRLWRFMAMLAHRHQRHRQIPFEWRPVDLSFGNPRHGNHSISFLHCLPAHQCKTKRKCLSRESKPIQGGNHHNDKTHQLLESYRDNRW